jgi:hypothetical protein
MLGQVGESGDLEGTNLFDKHPKLKVQFDRIEADLCDFYELCGSVLAAEQDAEEEGADLPYISEYELMELANDYAETTQRSAPWYVDVMDNDTRCFIRAGHDEVDDTLITAIDARMAEGDAIFCVSAHRLVPLLLKEIARLKVLTEPA